MNHALVGAFVLLLGMVLIGGVLWITSGGSLQKKFDFYQAIEEESVAGLDRNAPVKYNGVAVGKVRDIRLDPSNPNRVQLTLAIERGTPIKVDTVAVLKTQGLTGIAYVELDGGTQGSAILPASAREPYPQIRTKPSLATRLENVLTSVLAKLDRTSSNVDAMLSEENRAALKSTLADMASVSRAIAARKNEIDAGITNAAKTAERSARAAAQLGPVIAQIRRAAETTQSMGKDVSLASAQAAQTVGAVGSDAQRFASETLPEIQRLLAELNDLSTSLRRLSEQTSRDPAGLLRGRSLVPEGPGETPTNRVPP